MSARTFYVAASSSPEGVKAARALAARLEGAGMRWAFDWTRHLDANPALWGWLADEDVKAAVECDVFVLVCEPLSYGACVEFGARIGSGRVAYVLGPGGHGLFRRHQLVFGLGSVDVLLAVLAGEAQA